MAGSQVPADKCWQRLCGIGKDQIYNTELATEYQLKKYLLLLATLVATVTYAAGLNPPGGAWLEDDAHAPGGHLAGDSILQETSYRRYIVFYYFNAISFAASLLVGLLILIVHKDEQGLGNWLLLQLVRAVMVVDLLGLLGAYAVGSSHDRFTTICGVTVLLAGFAAYGTVALVTRSYMKPKPKKTQHPPPLPSTTVDDIECRNATDDKEHEILLVLAIFAATIGYVAGLNPPGGFWRSSQSQDGQHHTAGEPVLQGLHRTRYRAFFFFNTTGFVASLLAIKLVVSFDKLQSGLQKRIPPRVRKLALYGPIVTALWGLGGAYASGSCRDSKHTTYVVLVAASIFLLLLVARRAKHPRVIKDFLKHCSRCFVSWTGTNNKKVYVNWEKTREDLQLLAILVATIAYTAGVDPPGGVWAESGHGHNIGDPILLTTHPVRYKVFFYSNSAALVASLAIMVMLQSDHLVRKHALEAVMILDLFALIGAFAAGGARDTTTSVYTVALAGAVLIYVVIHIVFFTLDTPAPPPPPAPAPAGSTPPPSSSAAPASAPAPAGGTPPPSSPALAPAPAADGEKNVYYPEEEQVQKRRDVLLLLSILAATLTYQAGLTPPGGTWEEDGNGGHRAGFPVLLDKFPLRYKIFYYCNAASFMASVVLIVLLLNQNLYRPGIRCYALYVCMVAGMLGLMGAYSAGSSLHLKTSIVVLVFSSLLTVAAFAVAIYVKKRNEKKTNSHVPDGPQAAWSSSPATGGEGNKNLQNEKTRNEQRQDGSSSPATGGEGIKNLQNEKTRNDQRQDGSSSATNGDMMYLMLVGILGASVTYLTGLKPPGGTWREDGDRHSAGNPVLYDTRNRRYNAFFYSNSTSFMISINIITWLLVRMIWGPRGKDQAGFVVHLWLLHTAMVLDLLALLGAYAAGSARKWGTSTKVVLMLVPAVLIVWLVLFLFNKQTEGSDQQQGNTAATGQSTAKLPAATRQPATR